MYDIKDGTQDLRIEMLHVQSSHFHTVHLDERKPLRLSNRLQKLRSEAV